MRWNDRSAWIWSSEQTHQALVSSEDFAAVQAQMAVHGRQSTRKPRAVNRPYSLSGLIWCARCGRRMQGNWNHDAPHYRCRYGSEYALANQVDHPKTVYVKEAAIVPELDRWLARLFDPENLDETIAALASAAAADPSDDTRVAAARKKLVDCDDRIKKYRAALDSGADPVVVAGWLDEVRAERVAAEAALAISTPTSPPSEDEIRRLVAALGDVAQVLADADPAAKAAIYADLSVRLTYDHDQRKVVAEARPTGVQIAGVGGGT